jgi:hypothetical protein
MVTFYTKLIIHIKRSSLKQFSNPTLHQPINQNLKTSQRHPSNELNYHEYIYNQLYTLNRKNINNFSNNSTKFYLNNSPTETTINGSLQNTGETTNSHKFKNKTGSIKSRFSMNTSKLSQSYNWLTSNFCCCLTTPERDRARRQSTYNRKNRNNSYNSVININFRKCILSVPADNTSVSSFYGNGEKRFTDYRACKNDDHNNYELNTLNESAAGEIKPVNFRNRSNRTLSTGVTNHRRNSNVHNKLKRRNASFSFRSNSLLSRTTKSNSFFYAQKNEQNCESLNYQNLRIKRNRKAARMLGILIAAFTICWLPFTVVYPLSQFYPNLLPDYVHAIIWWLGYLNSSINPFLYVYSNRNIRRSVRNLFYTRFLYLFCRNKNKRNDSLTHNTSTRRIIGRHNNY